MLSGFRATADLTPWAVGLLIRPVICVMLTPQVWRSSLANPHLPTLTAITVLDILNHHRIIAIATCTYRSTQHLIYSVITPAKSEPIRRNCF